jgi:cardiolipin synthase
VVDVLKVDRAGGGVLVGQMKDTVTRAPVDQSLALPNLLTYSRIAAVPVVVACLFAQSVQGGPMWLRWVALAIFIAAGVTDFLDGYYARTLGQQSAFGRMLDPIADKLLVASCLLMLAMDETIRGWALWAAIIILCREILVSGLREYLAALKVSVPVTKLAKWKTAIQMIAIAVLLAGPALDKIVPYSTETGIVLLWVAAIVTLYTGYDYFRAGAKHIMDE